MNDKPYVTRWTIASNRPGMYGWDSHQKAFATEAEAIAECEAKFARGTFYAVVLHFNFDAPEESVTTEIGRRYPKEPFIRAGGWPLTRGGHVGAFRAYFIDADTGEELYEASWDGSGCSGIRNGRRYTDTALSFYVTDLETKLSGPVTAEQFPGRRVLVKVWGKNVDPEIRALVTEAKGWKGNEAAAGNLPRAELGAARMYRAVVKR